MSAGRVKTLYDHFLKGNTEVIARDLKEILNGINDHAEIYCGCEVGNRKFKIAGYEHPTGKKDKWDYIKLEYE